MRNLPVAIFISIMLLSCGQTNKKTSIDKDKKRIDNVCDKFMQVFSKGKYVEALQLLKQNSVLEPEKIDSLLVTIQRQSVNVLPAYGKMISSEFIVERKVKDFIAKRFYILKFDKYYLKFDFTLYKNINGWTITSFSYDEELIELLY